MIHTHPSERRDARNSFVVRAVDKKRSTRIVHYYNRFEWYIVNADSTFQRVTLEDAAAKAADFYLHGGSVFFGIDQSERFDWLVSDRIKFFGGGEGVDGVRESMLQESESAVTVDAWDH